MFDELLRRLVAVRPPQHGRIRGVGRLGPEAVAVALEQERRRNLADVLADARDGAEHARIRERGLGRERIVLLPGAGIRLAHDGPPAAAGADRRSIASAGASRDRIVRAAHASRALTRGRRRSRHRRRVGAGQAVAVRYLTVFVPTRFQLMYRSARSADARSSGTSRHRPSSHRRANPARCPSAARLPCEASIVTPPSSAYRMYCGCSAITFVVDGVADVMNCRPL